jgi:hypothetical protein
MMVPIYGRSRTETLILDRGNGRILGWADISLP